MSSLSPTRYPTTRHLPGRSSSEHAEHAILQTGTPTRSSRTPPRTRPDGERPAGEAAACRSPGSPPEKTAPSQGTVAPMSAAGGEATSLLSAPLSVTDGAQQGRNRPIARKTASSTTVGSDKLDRPRQVVTRQEEFDLASVLFAPLDASTSSGWKRKKYRRRPPTRSQSSHEVGASGMATNLSSSRDLPVGNGDESSLSSRPSSASSVMEDNAEDAPPVLIGQNDDASYMTTVHPGEFDSPSKKEKSQKTESALGDVSDRAKDPLGSRAGSPSKRHRLRAKQSRNSDSDTISSKYPKRVSFDNSDSSAAAVDADTREQGQSGRARGIARRVKDGQSHPNHAPLWQKVLKMLGLKKKQPVRSPPPAGTAWHKRRSSSVVLAESLAESAKHLDKNKEAAERTESKTTPRTEENISSVKAKISSVREKAKQAHKKKGKAKAAKKQHKRRRLARKVKVSPQSLSDPPSGSLTSIDFDTRRQTRSRARREQDSDSVGSSQVDSSSPSSVRRGRRTLASISAQTWEDCYRCTYLKWKEANLNPESLTIDEGFKVMTDELGTPRSTPSKDKKGFQKLLMSKWENIVQSAQTGSLGEEFRSEAQEGRSAVETNALSLVETPPVAAEFSVCTTDHEAPYSQEVHTDCTWLTDGYVTAECDRSVPDLSGEEVHIYSYGYPPALSPIPDLSENTLGPLDERSDTLDAAKAAGFIIPETLTEDTLRVLAECGSIDADLTGLQAFALFMPDTSGERDPYGDPGSSSPPPQPISNDDDDDDVPPVISCHRLDNFCGVKDDATNEEEEGELDVGGVHRENTNQSRSDLFYLPPSADGSGLDGFGHKLDGTSNVRLAQSREPGQQVPYGADVPSVSHDDSSLATGVIPGGDSRHSNEADDEALRCMVLQTLDSSTASLEEGEIIDDESRYTGSCGINVDPFEGKWN